MFDTDGSGAIEVDELKDMFTYTGIHEAVWAEMLKEVDENGDGVIEYDEFVNIMLAKT